MVWIESWHNLSDTVPMSTPSSINRVAWVCRNPALDGVVPDRRQLPALKAAAIQRTTYGLGYNCMKPVLGFLYDDRSRGAT